MQSTGLLANWRNRYREARNLARLALARLRTAALMRVARYVNQAPRSVAVPTLAYATNKVTPRMRFTLREAYRCENAAHEHSVATFLFFVCFKPFYYRLFRNASLGELYREFSGITDLHSYYEDATVTDHLFNGMYPLSFKQDPVDPTRLYWEQRFDQYATSGFGELPGLRFDLEMQGGSPRLTSITFYPRGEEGPIVRTPAAKESWLAAKMTAFGIWHFLASTCHHLVACHLNVEQYDLALQRNISPGNPLFKLLHPHVKGVAIINHHSEEFLWGTRGVLAVAGPVAPESFDKFLQDTLAQCDWKGWQPPMSHGAFHTRANAAQLYWSLLTEYVDRYFALHESELVSHWHEIEGFSSDLTTHSLARSDGSPAISPIAAGTLHEGLQNLKDVCRYVIYWVTFEHTRIHHAVPYPFFHTIHSPIDAYDRVADSPQWRDVYVKSAELLRFIQITYGLIHTHKVRSILQNYDGDIPELFLRILVARKPRFDAVGYDINQLYQVII